MMRGISCCISVFFFCLFIEVSANTVVTSSNVGLSSLEMFQNSWTSYKTVVEADLMEHKSMTATLKQAIDRWIKNYSILNGSPMINMSIADLGCGDLALLGPVYRALPLSLFCGVDMSLPALKLAREGFNGFAQDNIVEESSSRPETLWLNEDLLSWSRTIIVDQLADERLSDNSRIQQFDIIVCAFSVHHLNDEDKKKFLISLSENKLKKGGTILMADIFMIENEDRAAYLARFLNHINLNWDVLSEAQKRDVLEHVSENDYPASLHHFMSHMIPECGLSSELLWSDSNDFEKLLVLKHL